MKTLLRLLSLFALAGSALAGDYLGDFAPGTTAICGQFTTYNASLAPTTLAGTPALSVYKIGDGTNSATESTTGVTHAEDVDSRTGMNRVCIDTSADGTFYSAGGQFSVVITTGTVNSVSVVGSEVKSFSLNKTAALRPATAGRTLVVDAAGLADANTVKLGPTGSGTAQTARDIGTSVLLSNGTGTGQLSFTSGIASVNVSQIAGTAVTTLTGSYPSLGIIDSGTAQAATATTLQLRSAATFADSELIGATCLITGGTTGVGQSRTVTANVGSTDTATVATWTTTPTGTITYACFGTAAASAGGGPTAAQVATAVWQDAQGGDFTVASSIGKSLYTTGATPGATGGLQIAGSNAATTYADFDVTANVSLAGGLNITQSSSNTPALVITGNGTGNGATITSGSGATGTGLAVVAASTNGTGLTSTGTGTGNGATFTSGAGATGNGAQFTATSTNGNGIGLTATGTGATMTRTPANVEQIATQTASAAGTVTFPGTIASATNITAGTITTVTNLTNAPTAGDLTATMKSSVQTAVTGSQGVLTGTCSSGSTTTCVDAALTQAAASQLQDRLICFSDDWCGLITTFNPASDTVTTTKVAPATRASLTYRIFPSTTQ